MALSGLPPPGKKLVMLILAAMVISILIEAVLAPRYNIEPETARYFYSALFQGFAALAGLLLFILGLNYQRLKDSQEAYLSGAITLSERLHGSTSDDFRTLRDYTSDFFNNAFMNKVNQVNGMADRAKSKYPFPRLVDMKDSDVRSLRDHYGQVISEMEQYEAIVSNLGRFRKSAESFQNSLPAESLFAIAPAFIVMVSSALALGTVDILGTSQSAVARGMLAASIIAIMYAFSFFMTMLRILFGGVGKTPGYSETKLPEPHHARAVLEKVREITGWS